MDHSESGNKLDTSAQDLWTKLFRVKRERERVCIHNLPTGVIVMHKENSYFDDSTYC